MSTQKNNLLSLSLITTASIIATSTLTSRPVAAQTVEPVYPQPNSTNTTIDSTTPIEIRLTNQANINTSTVKFQLNGADLPGGTLSLNTANGTLSYKVTPTTFNIGDNTLQVQFQTKTGITSQFNWPFKLTGGTTATTPTTTTTTSTTTPTTPGTTTTTTIALKPQMTTQSFNGNALVLEGKTRPGATVRLTGQAVRPGTSLFSLGSVRIGSSDTSRSLGTTTVTADSQGFFSIQVDVLGDTKGTNYTMDLMATENNISESLEIKITR